jgi:hypothetical protein
MLSRILQHNFIKAPSMDLVLPNDKRYAINSKVPKQGALVFVELNPINGHDA